jgi:hypothetical protein
MGLPVLCKNGAELLPPSVASAPFDWGLLE